MADGTFDKDLDMLMKLALLNGILDKDKKAEAIPFAVEVVCTPSNILCRCSGNKKMLEDIEGADEWFEETSTEVSTPWEDMLKESMIRSLYRDSDKLIQTEDEQYISRLRSQIDKARTERDRESKKYLRLWKAVRKEFGDEKAWELIEKAEE